MTTTTTTTGKRTSRASRSAAQAQADQQPQEQPEPQQQEQPKAGQPKAAKPKLGPSGYRERNGSSDQLVVAAVREHHGDAVKSWTDEQVIAAAGWTYTGPSACRKVAALLAGREAAARA